MLNLEEVSKILGLKCNTLRYWLKKNDEDFEYQYYSVHLRDYIELMPYKQKIKSGNRKGCSRIYATYFIENPEKFVEEFHNYWNWKTSQKLAKINSKNKWTPTAIDCYNRKSDCNKCMYNEICEEMAKGQFNGMPPMKNVVNKLLEEVGEPLTFKREDIAPSIIQLGSI